jgi:hypothetical protein
MAADWRPEITPVRNPASRASFNPAPSCEWKAFISTAVPSATGMRKTWPAVSTPSTSISNTRILRARAATLAGNPLAGILRATTFLLKFRFFSNEMALKANGE